jgi:hypothetical protein
MRKSVSIVVYAIFAYAVFWGSLSLAERFIVPHMSPANTALLVALDVTIAVIAGLDWILRRWFPSLRETTWGPARPSRNSRERRDKTR